MEQNRRYYQILFLFAFSTIIKAILVAGPPSRKTKTCLRIKKTVISSILFSLVCAIE